MKQDNSLPLINADSICWREEWKIRYESLWSILHKFAVLNAVGSFDIIKYLGSELTKNNLRYKKRADLRYLNAVNCERLSLLLRVSKQSIIESTVTHYIKPVEIEELSSNSLRFCLSCLQEGFHSPIYQLLFLKKCLVHDEVLKNSCFACKREIPYQLSFKTLANPYCCSECNIQLSDAIGRKKRFLEQPDNRERDFETIVSWLINCQKFHKSERHRTLGNNTGDLLIQKQKHFYDVKEIAGFWTDAFDTDSELKALLAGKRKARYIHNKIDFRFNKRQLKVSDSQIKLGRHNLFESGWNQKLVAIYNSIKGKLIKSQLKNHFPCLNVIRNAYHTGYYSKESICCNAEAYLIWRMHLEGKYSIKRLQRNDFFENKSIHFINWDPPNYLLPASMLLKIFALECYWLFYECKLLAETLKKYNVCSFSVKRISGYLIPYWVIVEPANKGKNDMAELHWWVDVAAQKKIETEIKH